MEDSEELRQYITCDAKGCEKTNPSSRCSKCRMVYYCNRDCQKADWKRHKIDCHAVDEMRKKCTGVGDLSQIKEITGIAEGGTETAGPCGICLEEEITNPMIFTKCKHTFCFSCLVRFQSVSKVSDSEVDRTKCPYCRSEIPDFVESSKTRICVMTARAGRRDLPEEERAALVSTALADVQKLCDTGDIALVVFLTPIRAKLLSLQGKHFAALAVLQEVLPEWTKMAERSANIERAIAELRAQGPSWSGLAQIGQAYAEGQVSLPDDKISLRKTDLIEMYLHIADIQQDLEDWEAAKQTYQKIVMDFEEVNDFTAPQQRRVFMGSSVCAYHLKHYDVAIDLGEAALQTNRAFPGVHKVLALAYKADGRLDEARKLAAAAILHEAPWDDDNKEENWKFWKEITTE